MRAQTLPPWEDKAAVAEWAIATWVSESELVALAAMEADKADTSLPLEHRWLKAAAGWRRRAFEQARQRDFDSLALYIAIADLSDMTVDERKVMTDFIVAKSRRGKGRPTEAAPHNPNLREVSFLQLVNLAEQIKTLLIQHYGRHALHLTERAIDIAGERVGWYGLPPKTMRKRALAALQATVSN